MLFKTACKSSTNKSLSRIPKDLTYKFKVLEKIFRLEWRSSKKKNKNRTCSNFLKSIWLSVQTKKRNENETVCKVLRKVIAIPWLPLPSCSLGISTSGQSFQRLHRVTSKKGNGESLKQVFISLDIPPESRIKWKVSIRGWRLKFLCYFLR